MARRTDANRLAREIATTIGQEVALARLNLGLSARRAAGVAGVAPSTYRRIDGGDASVGVDTLCLGASAVGLKVWAKAFPVRTPTLRDTGQLRMADLVRSSAHQVFRVALEHPIGSHQSADLVLFGAEEIIHVEIERVLADFQAQYRSARAKRDELAAVHQRPVRLVLVVEDSARNRRVVQGNAELVRTALPATSRQVFATLRSGRRLGIDGLAWIRPRRER